MLEYPDDLTLDAYQKTAQQTAIYPNRLSDRGMAYVALGLAGEAGEIANKVKKLLRDKHTDVEFRCRLDDIAAELGDVMWYVAMMAEEIGMPLGKIARANLAKLASRKERGTLGGDGDKR